MTNQLRLPQAVSTYFYVGTYTNKGSQGIYLCQLDPLTGELTQAGVTKGVDNPSYLVIDAPRKRLFAVNETLEFKGRPGGSVSAFAIEPFTGDLQLINEQYSHGGAPCYLTVDQNGRFLFVANYLGSIVAVLPITPDGVLQDASHIITHTGHSENPKRQEAPHPHSVNLDPTDQFLFVPDLGLDKVMAYQFNPTDGRLTANKQPWTTTVPGSGPRHMVFHPNLGRAYIINELSSTITSYIYDNILGELKQFQTISTVPPDYSGSNISADLHLSPNGRFLYGSNRGHDSIAHYSVDQETGRLTLIDIVSTRGMKPRGFAIDPNGTCLLAANQDSNSIVSFWIDQGSGALSPTGHQVDIPSPVCLKFISLGA